MPRALCLCLLALVLTACETLFPTPTPTPRPTPGPTVTPIVRGPNPAFWEGPPDATAICRDGTYSYAWYESQVCVGHRGVARWINEPFPR